jgi:hypothetical protein
VAEYGKSDEGGTGEASGQNDIQSFDELSRTPSQMTINLLLLT